MNNQRFGRGVAVMFVTLNVLGSACGPADTYVEPDADMGGIDMSTDLSVSDMPVEPDEGVDADMNMEACAGGCSGATPVCDAANKMCVACLSGNDCPSDKSTCDTSNNTCVGCLTTGDCSGDKPACDVPSKTCVDCVGNESCMDASASKCSSNACEACSADSDCSHIAGKGVCDAGVCVGCTVDKEASCAGKSCDPATKVCTTTGLGSVGESGACKADSECNEGLGYRCIPLGFGPEDTRMSLGGFCLQQEDMANGGCQLPFRSTFSRASLSGASSESYCGINENITTCSAVLDMLGDEICTDDSMCGADGVSDGKCVKIGVMNQRCNIVCDNNKQCTSDSVCGTAPLQVGDQTKYCVPR